MSRQFNPRLATSDDTNELIDEQLDDISAGGAQVAHDDESPKETVTFEYGGLLIRYA